MAEGGGQAQRGFPTWLPEQVSLEALSFPCLVQVSHGATKAPIGGPEPLL